MLTYPRPFIPFPHGVKVEMRYLQHNQHIENVYNVRVEGGIDAQALIDINQVFVSWWEDTLRNIVVNTVRLLEVRATALDEEEALFNVHGVTTQETGGLNASDLPGHCTLSIRFSGGVTGHSRNGRSFFIGLNEDSVEGDVVTTVLTTQIIAAYNDLRDTLANQAYHLAIASYSHDNEWRDVGLLTDVVSFVTDGIVDSQRRRLTGRGR